MIRFDAPLWLWLLPLVLLPWWRRGAPALACAALPWLPADPASRLLQAALRLAAALAIGVLVLVLAGPYRPEVSVERVGTGAEIVLVLDRSRSMDQAFAGVSNAGRPPPKGTGPEALEYYMRQQGARSAGASKAKVSRQMLGEFAARRHADRFGMVAFSTLPIRVLDFTQKPEIIQAAIAAGEGSRGLAETDIGLALQSALDFFDDRPYTGSRLIMLVSDGGDHIEPDLRQLIAERAQRHRVGLTWIYLRATNSPHLNQADDAQGGSAEGLPEVFLHRFLGSLGVPYRAYEADNPEALKRAIDDVDRLENLPIVYQDTEPRRELAPGALAAALAAVALLFAAQWLERRTWA